MRSNKIRKVLEEKIIVFGNMNIKHSTYRQQFHSDEKFQRNSRKYEWVRTKMADLMRIWIKSGRWYIDYIACMQKRSSFSRLTTKTYFRKTTSNVIEIKVKILLNHRNALNHRRRSNNFEIKNHKNRKETDKLRTLFFKSLFLFYILKHNLNNTI